VGVGYAEWFSWSTEEDERLASLFYRHVDPADLAGRNPEAIVGSVTDLRRLAAHREPGQALVSARNPQVETDGWTCGRSVVSVVTDDMSFLVDSVTAELNRLGLSIGLLVHPIVAVERDSSGRLLSAESPERIANDISRPIRAAGLESWMHIEIDWQADPGVLETIEKNVSVVLQDVARAVADWPRMVGAARGLAAELVASPPPGIPPREVAEAIDLVNWLADDHFTFLGYREYRLVAASDDPDDLALVSDPGSGLGLLRSPRPVSVSFADLPASVRRKAREPRLLIVTKANRRSTVHRPVYLDYLGVKQFDRSGAVVGERRFIGLFSASAYTQSVTTVPIVASKVTAVREALGFARGSHGARDLMQFLETFPRDELFAIDTDELLAISEAALNLKERRATRVFLRRDPYERFLSCLIYLPRDRYTTAVRLRIQKLLADQVGATSVDYTAHVTESVLARLHVVVRVPRGGRVPELDADRVEAQIAAIARSWDDDLSRALVGATSELAAHTLLQRFPEGFPESYRESTSPAEAVEDLATLERLTPDAPVAAALRPAAEGSGSQANARLKLYSLTDISLAQVLPVLSSLGVQVVTERPFPLVRTAADGLPGGAFIFDIGLKAARAAQLGEVRLLWEEAFLACWHGRAEVDGFNGLVAAAGLDWRRVAVLRAYARYLRQTGTTFSQEYIESATLANPDIAAMLVELFRTAFDPDLRGDREQAVASFVKRVESSLDAVASLDEDRILRHILEMIQATLRTNYFQPDRPALALKLAPERIRDLPQPRPKYEIWVQSPRVEGVHLRFGAVARGGLRWSDRREDFRTEILGLVKAQAVKNAVIVPVGAKGGFYPKRLPDPSDREAWLTEGTEAYRIFVGSLLDLTDNRYGVEVVPPPRVVRRDGDDPYLVVAADKGTAAFSDIANEVAAQYGYWLGDAFASGGSEGYDHKAMGITARGAWESVREHFRVVGIDPASPFTVVGIGDMSGDVFGNGMLRSDRIKLVAAFDHRHIFLDPDPDPAASFAERARLFALPRSSWADYSSDLISAGGGVHPRTAKAITITEQVGALLGLTPGETLTPAEVLRAVLTARVDLLWNGGIGTYVKGSQESNADVGDRANDAIRVDGRQLCCRVVGEGGNLGLTQRGRIEAARSGVSLNTDAIDNSAGVDTSDHEVNIKILLDQAAAAGRLGPGERDPLLHSMTDEVARLVLRHNVDQNTMLTFEAHHGGMILPATARLIRWLERRGQLDRKLATLPSNSELNALAAEGASLSRPELSMLLAHTKLDLKAELLGTSVPDEPFAQSWLHGYVPRMLDERLGALLAEHPLRREIVVNGLVNVMVNRGGLTYALRAREETGAGTAELARAFTVTCAVFGLDDLWRQIDAAADSSPIAVVNELRVDVQRLLDRATRWLLQTRGDTLDVPGEIERFRPTVLALAERIPDLLVGAERERLMVRIAELEEAGARPPLSRRAAAILDQYSLLDITEVSRRTDEAVDSVAALYFTLSARFEVDRLLTRVTALTRSDRWASLARSGLRSDLYGALAVLTRRVVRATPEGGPPEERVQAWEHANAEGLARVRATLADIGNQGRFDLATLSVAMRAMRTLAQQG
jgi:glutamate dehydrogenase